MVRWPYWFTWGGEAGNVSATGPDWQTWFTSAECLLVWAVAWAVAFRWRWEASQATAASRRVKIDLFWQYFLGGFAVGGLRVLMIWVPAWLVFHCVMLTLLIVLLKYLVDRRGLRATFLTAEEVAQRAALLAEGAAAIAPYAGQESAQKAILRLARELNTLLGERPK